MSIHIFQFSVQLIYIAKRNKKIKRIRKMEKNGEQRKTHHPKMSPLPGYHERMKLSRKTTQLYLSPNEIHFDIRELCNTNK